MAYERQVQEHLDNLDHSLKKLYDLIKRGKQTEALRFMDEGELKDRFEELRNITLLSTTQNFGSRGVQNTRNL
jgi:hypothetical protein